MSRVGQPVMGGSGSSLLATLGALSLACSGGDASGPTYIAEGAAGAASVGAGGASSVAPPPNLGIPPEMPPPNAGGTATVQRVVPTDTRPLVSAELPPPPISGGTLGTTADGAFVVVADSDRDRVLLVDSITRQIAQEITLELGDEPGRVTAGAGQQVFVALRRAGAVVTLDPVSGLAARRAACLAPRGLAYDAVLDELHVACAEGKLVTFTGAAAEPSRVLDLDGDLRDVVLSGGRLFISRLRSAELLEIGSDGTLLQRSTPSTLMGTVVTPAPPPEMPPADPGANSGILIGPAVQTSQEPFAPAVAWRTVAGPDGSVHMLHQRGQESPVRVDHDDPTMMDPYGGGGNPCGGIVRSSVTRFRADGVVAVEAAPSLPLAVDVALSPNGRYVAIASAGIADPLTPQPSFEFVDSPADGVATTTAAIGFLAPVISGIQVLNATVITGLGPAVPEETVVIQDGSAPVSPLTESADRCDFDIVGSFVQEPVVAVAFHPTDNSLLYAQTRSPASLYFIDMVSGFSEPLLLGGAAVQDTAHDLFHRSAGAGIACASCHPEGMDDGRVWEFEGLGLRRTQPLDVGLQGTAPFHWDGSLQSVGALMEEVFVGRMGGVFQSPERLAALENWLFSLTPLPPTRAVDDPEAVRGGELFHSEAVGCVGCHSGAAFTNNQSYHVGTTPAGQLLQVPGLLGVGYRTPLMHDGCAATLAARFDAECGGGDAHGVTANLSPDDIAALVAYLETL